MAVAAGGVGGGWQRRWQLDGGRAAAAANFEKARILSLTLALVLVNKN